METVKSAYQLFMNSLRNKLTRVQFIMIIATLVGLISGLFAVTLKVLVHQLQLQADKLSGHLLFYIFLPAIGLVSTVLLVRYILGGTLDKGISMVLKSIAVRSSFIPRRHTYLHIITSSLTVGFGGSAGLEAPIVATGSAIGSNIARITDLSYAERTLLLACGAAAGIAAVFNAPIAGVIFAVEILIVETIVSYFIPLIISSVVGALCSKIILSESFLFNFSLKQAFDYKNVPFYILLGILAGFVSLYYARSFKFSEKTMFRWSMPPVAKALTGGALLIILYLILPPLFGEGYNSVTLVANGSFKELKDDGNLLNHLGPDWGIIIFAGLIVLFKPVAAGLTIGSGGNGGNFAPSLFSGAYLGFFFSRLVNNTQWVKIPVGNFSLVGMAGVLSGVMYCPLTAVFLIAEITNGYELFIPLMIVSSISFFIVKSYQPFSMDTRQLAESGQIFTHRKEQNILTTIKVEDILQEEMITINPEQQFADLVRLIEHTDQTIFAVVSANKLKGIIELNDIKRQLFESTKHASKPIRIFMKEPHALISPDQTMASVLDQFELVQAWHIPVLTASGDFVGFLSKSKLFAKYREILSEKKDLYE